MRRWESARPPVVSAWAAIHQVLQVGVICFSILLAMLLSYGLGVKEMGCLPASSQGLD